MRQRNGSDCHILDRQSAPLAPPITDEIARVFRNLLRYGKKLETPERAFRFLRFIGPQASVDFSDCGWAGCQDGALIKKLLD